MIEAECGQQKKKGTREQLTLEAKEGSFKEDRVVNTPESQGHDVAIA